MARIGQNSPGTLKQPKSTPIREELANESMLLDLNYCQSHEGAGRYQSPTSKNPGRPGRYTPAAGSIGNLLRGNTIQALTQALSQAVTPSSQEVKGGRPLPKSPHRKNQPP